MSTTLSPESKTCLQVCTISCESLRHLHNFWTSWNDWFTRYVRMETNNYDILINIGGSEVLIGHLYLYVTRRTIFTTYKRCRGNFKEVMKRTRTNWYKCWTGVMKTRCIIIVVHDEKREHMAIYRWYVHEIVRHRFNNSSTFLRN
jgi:hypothetical protein